MHRSRHFVALLALRSVSLVSTFALASAVVVQANAADSAGSPAARPSATSAPPEAANPARQPPAASRKNDAPPMTTSPAFRSVTNADDKTGSARDPDTRPEIEATRPTGIKPTADQPSAAK